MLNRKIVGIERGRKVRKEDNLERKIKIRNGQKEREKNWKGNERKYVGAA
jgi:hypothetical protein